MAPTDSARLRAGVDYPADLSEFDRFFPNEEACTRYLERLRWPAGFVCPQCGVRAEAWRMSRGLLLCTSCRAQTSVTAGTTFAGTRKPLRIWFIAEWEITGHKYGANAANVKRMLGLKSYKTAWSWLHKFRRAMVRPGRDRLSGVIEVDETYVGGEAAAGQRPLHREEGHCCRSRRSEGARIRPRTPAADPKRENRRAGGVRHPRGRSGSCQHRLPELLPRRVRFPLQPAAVRVQGAALLPSSEASGADRPHTDSLDLSRDRERQAGQKGPCLTSLVRIRSGILEWST